MLYISHSYTPNSISPLVDRHALDVIIWLASTFGDAADWFRLIARYEVTAAIHSIVAWIDVYR